jgi:hypothetical protein
LKQISQSHGIGDRTEAARDRIKQESQETIGNNG